MRSKIFKGRGGWRQRGHAIACRGASLGMEREVKEKGVERHFFFRWRGEMVKDLEGGKKEKGGEKDPVA